MRGSLNDHMDWDWDKAWVLGCLWRILVHYPTPLKTAAFLGTPPRLVPLRTTDAKHTRWSERGQLATWFDGDVRGKGTSFMDRTVLSKGVWRQDVLSQMLAGRRC